MAPARRWGAKGEAMRGVVRASGFVLAIPLVCALAACAGPTGPGADWPTHADGEHFAGGPGSPFPLLSWDDREAIGRVTYAEAGNQGEDGIAAVIFTILNRVNSGQFGASVQDVIDAPNQFEPATRAGGWRYLPPLNPRQSVEFETILDSILAGELPDLTGGALFFQNTRIVAARAARGRVSSYLVDFGGTPPVAEIGDHRFYDWRAAINLAARRRQSEDAWPVHSTDGWVDTSGQDEILATEQPSEEMWPEPELPAMSAADAWQAIPSASADTLAAEPWQPEPCTAGAYC